MLLDSLAERLQNVGPVESDLYFRLSSGSRGSDTVHVRVRLPAFLGALKVTARYPNTWASKTSRCRSTATRS